MNFDKLPNYGLIHYFAAINPSDEDFLSREIISCHQRALSSSALNKSDPFIFLVKDNPVGIYIKCILECPKFIASMVMELYFQRHRRFLSNKSVYGLKPNKLDWRFNTIHIYKFLNPVGIFVKCVHECPKFIVSKVSK